MVYYSVYSYNFGSKKRKDYFLKKYHKSAENLSIFKNQRWLLSYADINKLEDYLEIYPRDRLVFDSGAFTLVNNSKPPSWLNISNYMLFLKKYQNYRFAFNFDLIGANPKHSYNNLKRLEAQKLERILPVFHLGEKYEWLKRYIDEGYNYIGLGGVAGATGKREMEILEKYLNKCFSLGKKYGIMFHGLGMTSRLASDYPFFSVDSRNALFAVMRGTIDGAWTGRRHIHELKNKKDYIPPLSFEDFNYKQMWAVIYQQTNYLYQYYDTIKKNWFLYDKYFQGEYNLNDVMHGVEHERFRREV